MPRRALAEGALLVAGDDVSVGMRVGPGVRLEVVEPAGTVAFDMRGGSARWGVAIEVDDGGELVWRAEPFVVATGAVVERDVEVALAGSGAAVLREVLVLGRVREAEVRPASDWGTRPREAAAGRGSSSSTGSVPRVGVLGSHRVVDSVTRPARPPAPPLPRRTGSELDGRRDRSAALRCQTHPRRGGAVVDRPWPPPRPNRFR